MSEQQNELQMIPKWEEIESSQNWKEANEMKRSQVRSAWLQDLLRLRDAGYVSGTDEDFVKILKKKGWQSGQIAFAFNRHAREAGEQGQGLNEDATQMNLHRDADPMFAPGTVSGSLSTNLELGIGRVAKVPQEALNALTFGQVEPLHDYVNNYRNYLDNERSLANVESAMIDGFKKGGVVGFGKAMGNSLLQETPNFLMQIGLTAVGGPMAGRAYMALSAMGDKFAEIQDDESLSPQQKMAIVATSTLFEVAWEELNTIPFAKKLTSQYGGAALREVFRSQGFKKAMLTIAKHIGKNANMEGWEEFFTEASQGISEKLIRDGNLSFDDIKEIVYNSTNAYLGGAAMGGVAEGAKTGVDIMGIGSNASRKAFAKHLGVTENNLPDKYNSASKRQAALDNYELHGEPITAEEPTVKDVRDALTDRLQWYAKLKDNDIRKQYDANAQEWQQKLNDLADMPDNDIVQLPNRERDLTQEREAERKEREVLGKGMRNLLGRMRMPGDRATNIPAQETTTTEQPTESPASEETRPTEQEQPEPPKAVQEPPVQADDTDKAEEENERRRQEAVELEERNKQRKDYIAERMKYGETHEAQHSDGTAAGEFEVIIADLDPAKGYILTSSDEDYAKLEKQLGIVAQNREPGAEREKKIRQIVDRPLLKKFFDYMETHLGMPIASQEGLIYSGNTRADALRQMYLEGKADDYKYMVAELAAKQKTSIEGMKMPFALRVWKGKHDAKAINDFVRRANINNEMRGMSDANRAQDDAAAFADNQDELLSLYHPPADQNLLVGPNDMTFLNRFRELVGADPNDVDENAHYTERFFNRIRNTFLGSLFSKLPNGRDLVKSFTNTDKMKTVLNGLMPSIPRLLKQGAINPEYDITPILGKALTNLRRYKIEQESNGSRLTPEEFARQGVIMNEDGSMMTPEQAAAYRMDDAEREMFLNLANIRSMKEMRQFMNQYMNAVSETAGINDMDNGKRQMSFFEEAPRSREEIIKGLKDFVKKRQSEAESRKLRRKNNSKRESYAVAYDKEAQAASPLIEGARVATKAELRKAGLEGGTKKTVQEDGSVEKVNRLVDRAKTLFPGFKFVVHATQEEASQFVDIPEGKTVNAWNDNGTIHVVAENLAKQADPYQILTGHEIIGHSGLKMVIGKRRWNTAMDGIFRDHAAEIQQAVKDYGYDYGTEDGRVAAAEEWLATVARMDTKPSWWKALISKIRDMLRMAGMNRLKWTDADIENLIAEGNQAARTSADAETQIRDMAESEPKFSIRKEEPPKKTGIGYKVFFQKDGKLYPPMIANPGGEDTPVGVWLNADAAPVVGESKTGRMKVKQGGKGTQGGSGTLAYRPGWHLGEIPYALQFNRGEKVDNPVGMKNEKGELIKVGRYFPKDFVWAEVEYAMDEDYQQEAESYGYDEKGKFRHSFAGLPKIPKDGYYRYRTNPNPATDPWIITGAMKVNRVLSKDEVDSIVSKAGRTPQEVEPNNKTNNSVKFSLENATPSKAGYKVEKVNETCGEDLNKAQGVVCEEINQVFDPKDAPSTEFKAWITDKISSYMSRNNLLNRSFPTPALNGDVKLAPATAYSLGNHTGKDAKYNIVPVIPQMLENAVLIQTEAHVDPKNNKVNSRSHLLASKVRYDGERYVAVMVIHDNNGVKYYDHSVMLISEADILKGDPSASGPETRLSASVLNVAQKALLSSGFDKNNDSNTKFSLEQIAPLPAKQEEAEERILDAVSTHPVEDLKALRLPLMIDLANALGSSVKSTDRLPPGVLGQFRHDGPSILLLRKLAAGKELGDAVVTNDPDAQAEQQLAYWEKLGVPRDEVEVIIRPIEGSDESVVKLIWKDRTLSLVRKVAAHEVGHLVDFTSGSTTKHGNILGTVAGTLHKYLKHVIGEDSDSPIDWSAWEKRKRELHKQAEKLAGTKPTEETALKAWRKTVKDNYRTLYDTECEQNNWFQKAVIRDELQDLTEWWSGDITDPEYRLRPTELYAEAMSVLFNSPEQLSKRAPETWRMIQNYLAEKPLFASEWQRMMEIMSSDEAYGEELLNMQEQGFDMGEAKKGTTAAEPTWKDRIKNIGKDALRSVQDIFYDINEAAADLRKRGVMGWNESPDAAISEARHSSIRDAYMKAASILEQPLLDAGLTLKDVGLYLMNMRLKNDLTIKDNVAILNSYGMNSTDDPDYALSALRRRLSEGQWAALEDWHKKYWKLRQDTILRMAAESGAYSDELVQHLLDNEWYSYRMVTTQLLDDDGREKAHGSGARIYGLKGTLSPQANPLGWTYENDLRLMNGLLWNDARMKTGEMMKHHFASLVQIPKIKGRDMKGNFIYSDPAEGMARVTYLKDGKLERVDIPETWAAGFAKGGANESLKTLSFLTNIWRLAYTTYSRTFGAQNPIRDFEGTFQNMTYMGDKSSWMEWSRYWWEGMKEAFGEEFGNDKWFRRIFGDSYVNGSAISQEMERLNMFQSEAHGYGDAQTQHDRLLQRYGIVEMEPTGWQKYIPAKARKIQEFVSKIVNAEEHGAKIGGYLMMDAKMPNMSMEEKRWHVHRHIGSPDFTVKGRFTPLTNTILIFSNASIQGWKATAESYKTNPKAYAANWMYSVALPKFIQWSLASGVMLAAAKAVGMDDDNPLCKLLDWFKRMYGKISQYNRANYMCLPVAETTSGKCVFVRIPMAENSKPGAMVFQAMLESIHNDIPNAKSAAEKTGDAVAGALPNWNPMLMFGWDAGWLAAGHNVRDFHTGRPAVDQDMWNAGGIYRAWGSAKYLWHEYVPETGFRFDTRNNTWLYDLIANNLGFGALVKLSDYGEKEQERAVKEIRRNEKARAKMTMPGARRK